ncbi:5004_t:CDS:1, partial [Racocetra fulgida]
MLIGVSCFDRTDTLTKKYSKKRRRRTRHTTRSISSSSLTLEEGYMNVRISPYTWILSTYYQDRIITSVDDTGGVIRFLADESSTDVDVVIVHVLGISKTTIEGKYLVDNSYKTNAQIKPAEDFLFPMVIASEIGSAEGSNPNLQLYHRSIEKNYFMAENYRFDLLEMYSLKTGEHYKTFHIREEATEQLAANGNSIFEISKNDVLLAFCRGTNIVSIYLMENTLEISTKLFSNLYRINSIDFVHNDEKLLLIGEEEKVKDDGSTELVAVILIWDLYSECDDSVKIIKDTQNIIRKCTNVSTKFVDHYHRFSSSNGFIVGVDEENGDVFSIVDHPDLADYLNPSVPSSELVTLVLPYQEVSSPLAQIYHYIYTQDGRYFDAKQEPKQVIVISNAEPWVRYKQHSRISAYLNNDKKLQVIMGLTTIQVWRKNDYSKYKRRLEYIWISPHGEKFDVQRLLIGNGEFFVELLLPESKQKIEIHWPHKCST